MDDSELCSETVNSSVLDEINVMSRVTYIRVRVCCQIDYSE